MVVAGAPLRSVEKMRPEKNMNTAKNPILIVDPLPESVRRRCVVNNPTKIVGLKLQPGTGVQGRQKIPANFRPPLKELVTPRMSAEATAFLAVRHFPARLNEWQVSLLLGITANDLRTLVQRKVLAPLDGNPGQQRYFATIDIWATRRSVAEMKTLTQSLYRHWKK